MHQIIIKKNCSETNNNDDGQTTKNNIVFLNYEIYYIVIIFLGYFFCFFCSLSLSAFTFNTRPRLMKKWLSVDFKGNKTIISIFRITFLLWTFFNNIDGTVYVPWRFVCLSANVGICFLKKKKIPDLLAIHTSCVYTLFVSQLAWKLGVNCALIEFLYFIFFLTSRFDYKCEIEINLRAMYVLSTLYFEGLQKQKKKLDKNIYVNYDVIR